MALSQLDRLLDAISPEELRVVEEIIAARPELAVETNVARNLQRKPSLLSEQGSHAGDDFVRRGLAWVMALARVELGAMAAGFTDEEDPFSLARPSNYELPAYIEVLSDGMRSHYWSLAADRVAKNPRQAGLSDSQAVAYVRRVHVALSFLRAFRDRARPHLAPAQITELRRWENDLEKLKWALLFDVLKLGTHLAGTGGSTQVKSQRLRGSLDVADSALAELPDCVKNAVRDVDGTSPPSPAETPAE
ncbi:MAG: hypothetical protein WD847_04790 [Pirellulales bacterium]